MRAADMPLTAPETRRPIDMIPILDGWIATAEETIASRWSTIAWEAGDHTVGCTLHPLPDLLFVLQLMRQYRDQLLTDAGYAVASESLPQATSSPLPHSEQQLDEFVHHPR